MRKTLFYAVLFAIPLAAGANAPESDEQDPEIEQGLNQQEQRGQETDPQFEEAAEETAEETEQGFEATGEEFEDAAQETEQEFEEAGSEMDQETEAEVQEASAGQDMQQGGGEPELKRAQFTTDVQDKEPVDEVENVEASEDPIYFFTEVENAEGQTITHRWKRDGEVMAEVPLQVGSNEWRTWSSKEMMPDWDGEWTVEVVDAQGNTISEESVTVERGQQQNVSYSEDEQQQEDQMQEAGQQDEQTESEDWQDVEFQDDAQAEDTEAEAQEEDWQSVEYEDSAQDPQDQQQDPTLQEAGEQQDDQATDDQEDWTA